jgi:RHS repeat-associated protein
VTRIYSAPVNYRGSDGEWHPIDTSLVSGVGGYENAANSFALRIPESLTAGVSLTSGGDSLSFSLDGAATAPAAVSGSTATYNEVLPSTDLSYTSLPDGVEEVATLKDAAAPEGLSYQLSLSAGLEPRAASNGSIAIVEASGQVAFALPAPVAYPAAAGAEAGRRLALSVAADPGGWQVTVQTDQPWLRAALESGAVIVDPTVKARIEGTGWCTLAEEAPSTAECEGTSYTVGYDSTHKEHHALVYFPMEAIKNSVVLDATFHGYVYRGSTSNTKSVGIYRVTKAWTHSTTGGATWLTYDGTHNWETAGGDYSNPSENSDASVISSAFTSPNFYAWPLTKMVQEWVNGPSAPAKEGYANDGMIIKDQTDNETPNLIDFKSKSTEGSYLEVVYEPRGMGSSSSSTMLTTALTDRSSASVNAASGNLLVTSDDLNLPGIAGLGFTSIRGYNSLNKEAQEEYASWSDSNWNANHLWLFADGNVAMEGPTGTWYSFVHQANDSFIRPAGLKATLCEAGSPEPCPKTLPSGVKYRLEYDASGDYVEYSAEGSGKGVHDRYGNSIGVEYGKTSGKTYTDPHGHKIEESQNVLYSVTEIKDVTGERKTKYTYGASGAELQLYTDANGKETKYTYEEPLNEVKLLTSITDPDGHKIAFEYDTSRRVKKILRYTNTEHTKAAETTFTYYEGSEVPAVCGGSAKATVVHDPDWTASKAHETTYCSNVLDEVEKTVNANGAEAKATYDPFGNQLSATAPARETGGAPGVTSVVYDEETGGQDLECEVVGTEKSVSTCPRKAEKQGYASEGRYADTKYPYQATSAISARQKTTKLCYWEGSASCTAEGAGAPGALKQQTLPLTGEPKMNYTYNSHGQVTSSTDADGHKTTYEYDSSHDLSEVIPPSGSGIYKETITSDAIGRPHIIKQCLNESCSSSETSTLTYDKLDRVTEAVDTGPGATKTFKYTYDGDGNLEKRVDPTGTTNYTYDELGRLTEESLPGSLSDAYAYDNASNLMSFTDSGGTTMYFYDGLNELEAMHEPGGSCSETPSKCTTATYDGDGTLTKITYPSKASVNYGVEPLSGSPTTITVKNASGETVLSHTYSYTSEGDDTPLIFKDTLSQPGTGTAETFYEYDPLDRLLNATSKSTVEALKSHYVYELDHAGNRTKQEVNTSGETGGGKTYYDYNSGNELECRMKEEKACSKSATSELAGYSYDGAGNETAITGYSETGNTSFTYNNLEQLKSLTPPGASEETATYLGSGQHNLTGLGTVTLQNSLLGTTKQINESGTSYYARTPDGLMVDERLPGGTSYNPIFDSQGDLIGLLNTSGNLVQTIRYGPYGENAKTTGSTYTSTIDPFLYQGGYHVAWGTSGTSSIPNDLYHYGERYYDPTAGRWTQQDPLFAASEYTFAGDDPINATDPTGMLSGNEIFDYGLTAAGCLAPESGIGDYVCAGGVSKLALTHKKSKNVIEKFYKGIEEAASLGKDIG